MHNTGMKRIFISNIVSNVFTNVFVDSTDKKQYAFDSLTPVFTYQVTKIVSQEYSYSIG